MVLGVSIKKTPDHSLILGIVLLRLGLEELHATPAQSKRYLDSFIPKDQIIRTRKEVGNNFKLSEGLVCVFDFRAHRFAFLFASNLPRKYGSQATSDP